MERNLLDRSLKEKIFFFKSLFIELIDCRATLKPDYVPQNSSHTVLIAQHKDVTLRPSVPSLY